MPEVHVVGRILRARGFAPHARLSCHWRVVLDDSSRHWRVLEGAGGGETVVSERVMVGCASAAAAAHVSRRSRAATTE